MSSATPAAAAEQQLRARAKAIAKKERMLSVQMSRGETTYGFYERLYPLPGEEQDFEEDSDTGDEQEHDGGSWAQAVEAKSNQATGTGNNNSNNKGKARATPYSKPVAPKPTHNKIKSKRYSLNARRPIITLRRDSGWDFSQDAFFASYTKEEYKVAHERGAAEGGACEASLAECDCFDADSRRQPRVVDIVVSDEDRRRILP